MSKGGPPEWHPDPDNPDEMVRIQWIYSYGHPLELPYEDAEAITRQSAAQQAGGRVINSYPEPLDDAAYLWTLWLTDVPGWQDAPPREGDGPPVEEPPQEEPPAEEPPDEEDPPPADSETEPDEQQAPPPAP
ncbi:hypothetical protein [Sphaerisporangium sp. TRM90804]|uniref:hypothetical protein n=1 Tax=Sphaerisporangium sp. TRM90804 TaxID=3031113 RepID=UPI00244B5ACE|nr:hypothetical protein [Sphaerisporangium sp. TRM90804]MDH2429308.1 hypothetical protein [Sphaerisporangium sp. TRM90804]